MDDWRLERFYHTIINAKDIDETVAFYQALGFSLQRRTARFAALHWGEAALYLIEEPDRPAVAGPSIANILVLLFRQSEFEFHPLRIRLSYHWTTPTISSIDRRTGQFCQVQL